MLSGLALSPNPGRTTPRNVATAPHSVHDAQNGLVCSMSVLLLTPGPGGVQGIDDDLAELLERLRSQRHLVISAPLLRGSVGYQIILRRCHHNNRWAFLRMIDWVPASSSPG